MSTEKKQLAHENGQKSSIHYRRSLIWGREVECGEATMFTRSINYSPYLGHAWLHAFAIEFAKSCHKSRARRDIAVDSREDAATIFHCHKSARAKFKRIKTFSMNFFKRLGKCQLMVLQSKKTTRRRSGGWWRKIGDRWSAIREKPRKRRWSLKRNFWLRIDLWLSRDCSQRFFLLNFN